MDLRKFLSVIGIVCSCALVLIAAPVALALGNNEPLAASCADLHLGFDRHEAVVQSEERTITRAEAPTLRIQADANGGMEVEGWDKDDYGVTLCKAAEAGSDAQSVLSAIHLTYQNGEIGVTGPSRKANWSAHLLVRAPKAASLDLRVQNGPMSLNSLDGHVKIRAVNGPVTVEHCTGELELSAENGPVTLEGNNGKQNVQARNGPLTLTLAGQSWTGSGVEAHATNGPVLLRIPSGYLSGAVLEAGSGPFECRARVCSEGRKTWDDDQKRMEFGSGPAVIHLSTVNGPISVR